MQNENQRALNLKVLEKGPVTDADLDWPLNAEVKYFIDEGPAIRIGFNVHTTMSGDVLFEDRIWDKDYKPNHPLNKTLKAAVASSKVFSQKRLALWGKILKVDAHENVYEYMKSGDILRKKRINLSVKICRGNYDIQYLVIVASRLIDREGTWMDMTEEEVICLQGLENQEDYERNGW